MRTENHRIKIGNNLFIDSTWLFPDKFEKALIIAHGAGQGMDSTFISSLHHGFADGNILTAKFNFPYISMERTSPDRAEVLLMSWQAIIDNTLKISDLKSSDVFLSGKSMGGRFASILESNNNLHAGLIFFGYPLHAPGKINKLNYDHLVSVTCPLLFIQGDRDNLCNLEQLDFVFSKIKSKPDIHVIKGANHSFKVLKSLNRSEESVNQEIIETSLKWIRRHS